MANTDTDKDKIQEPTDLKCKKCKKTMVKWVHSPKWRPKVTKGHYPYWYECKNRQCKVTQYYEPGSFIPSLVQLEEIAREEMLAHG